MGYIVSTFAVQVFSVVPAILRWGLFGYIMLIARR